MGWVLKSRNKKLGRDGLKDRGIKNWDGMGLKIQEFKTRIG